MGIFGFAINFDLQRIDPSIPYVWAPYYCLFIGFLSGLFVDIVVNISFASTFYIGTYYLVNTTARPIWIVFYLDIRLFFWFFRLFPSLDICLHLAFSRGWGRFSKVLWLEKLEILLYLLIFTHSRPCKSSFLLTLEVVKANFYNL